MIENESCIGSNKALKQMQEADQLLTQFFYYYGGQSCNVKVLWKNPALKHESMALAKGKLFLNFRDFHIFIWSTSNFFYHFDYNRA